MDYIGKKLTTFTADTISELNESKRKQNTIDDNQRVPALNQATDGHINPSAGRIVSANLGGQTKWHNTQRSSPLAGGFPFGGDSTINSQYAPSPPPIGFRTDLLATTDRSQVDTLNQNQQVSSTTQPEPGQQAPFGASDESLYQGDGWTRLWFQRVMILSLLRLLLFVRKVYEDFQATKTYNTPGRTGHFLVSAAALFLPTIVFTIYRVSRYLQLTLPALRASGTKQFPVSSIEKAGSTTCRRKESAQDDHDATRALMSSPGATSGQNLVLAESSSSNNAQINEDDGLVTARQTPTNTDDFHDSKSHQDTVVSISPRPTLNAEPKLESVNIDKLGDLPDKETTRVVIGASEQFLHGVLFIFWQLKRQVDVMGYLVERACLWRKPRESEKEELGRLGTSSDGLEWFQDFYAAFLAIMTQVYTLGVYWSEGKNVPFEATSINAATNALSGSNMPRQGGDVQLSQSANLINNILGQHTSVKGALAAKDLIIYSQMIVSSAVILSLLVAVRRHDDGPLTLGLSMIGWGSMFAARIIIIAMAFVHIGWYIMLPLVLIHVIAITSWIYKIAIDSHNDEACEREMEAEWDEETAAEIGVTEVADQEIELEASTQVDPTKKPVEVKASVPTFEWSTMEHLVLLAQIFILFAIPSIFYWPIMFNLKFHQRPFKYLLLILTQNFVLIPAIWYMLPDPTPGQLYLLGSVGCFSIIGFIFVSMYIACKPSLTEYFARADELFNEAGRSGIYFEFCSRVFKMPDLSKHSFKRLMDQTERIVEDRDDDVPRSGEVS